MMPQQEPAEGRRAEPYSTLDTGMVAEGDRVAVEVVSEGDLTNGRQYRQEYHMLLEFREGKISAVREYLDTQHAHAIWIAPEP